MSGLRVPFNVPYTTGREHELIEQAIRNQQLSARGAFSEKCEAWLEETTGSARVLLTHSGTAALEMAAILAGIQPGDEVIMPSFTFCSTASAFVLRGGVPAFVDIREDTLNIDEAKIEAAITPRTRAIAPMHYAGVGCRMEEIGEIAGGHGLKVIEDAAHGLLASYHGQPLGSLGDFAILSFHETKNIISGEGGALLVNDPGCIERAEIVLQKGTNRSQFRQGLVDHYSWVDLGSSYAPSELTAAFLWAQMSEAQWITQRRLEIWTRYNEALYELEQRELLRRPVIPPGCEHNAHIFFVILPDRKQRDLFLEHLNRRGIYAVFHYIPLHSSKAGRRYGRSAGKLEVTTEMSGRLARLPLWAGMSDETVDQVIEAVFDVAGKL